VSGLAALLSPDEWQAVRLSLSVAARSVAFGLPLAVLAAYALARGRFWGRSLLDAAVHLPLVLPPVVVGWGLLLLFGVRGPVGALLQDWFGIRLVFTSAGAALATGVMAFPLMVRAIRLSLEAVDPGLEAAARPLGAGPASASSAPSSPSPPTSRARPRRCRSRSTPPPRCPAEKQRPQSCRPCPSPWRWQACCCQS